jgi:hypothetical protein
VQAPLRLRPHHRRFLKPRDRSSSNTRDQGWRRLDRWTILLMGTDFAYICVHPADAPPPVLELFCR